LAIEHWAFRQAEHNAMLCFSDRHTIASQCAIALFTVSSSHLHYNVLERGCEAISGNFVVSARNCLTSMFKFIVMQMRKVNCEKGYCPIPKATFIELGMLELLRPPPWITQSTKLQVSKPQNHKFTK